MKRPACSFFITAPDVTFGSFYPKEANSRSCSGSDRMLPRRIACSGRPCGFNWGLIAQDSPSAFPQRHSALRSGVSRYPERDVDHLPGACTHRRSLEETAFAPKQTWKPCLGSLRPSCLTRPAAGFQMFSVSCLPGSIWISIKSSLRSCLIHLKYKADE